MAQHRPRPPPPLLLPPYPPCVTPLLIRILFFLVVVHEAVVAEGERSGGPSAGPPLSLPTSPTRLRRMPSVTPSLPPPCARLWFRLLPPLFWIVTMSATPCPATLLRCGSRATLAPAHK